MVGFFPVIFGVASPRTRNLKDWLVA